jgi:hypothetical protein
MPFCSKALRKNYEHNTNNRIKERKEIPKSIPSIRSHLNMDVSLGGGNHEGSTLFFNPASAMRFHLDGPGVLESIS